MRIYKMTATFGKLENQTLTLEPGLNIITAPNEWGKSTWCAFLMAMLYGLDTREKTTKSSLAAKERFAPWSGSPMEGRIDLNWQGRDITIQRQTKRRVPLGEFRAFETASGVPVTELTAANCGQQLWVWSKACSNGRDSSVMQTCPSPRTRPFAAGSTPWSPPETKAAVGICWQKT